MFVQIILSNELKSTFEDRKLMNGVCPEKSSELGALSELLVVEISDAYCTLLCAFVPSSNYN